MKDLLNSLLVSSHKSVPKFLGFLETYIRDHHWKNGIEFCSRLLRVDSSNKEMITSRYGSQIIELLRVSLGAGAVKGEELNTRLHTAWILLPEFLKGNSETMSHLHTQVMNDLSPLNSYEENISNVCVMSVVVGLFEMGMNHRSQMKCR